MQFICRIRESQRSAMIKDSKRFEVPNIQPPHYFHMDHSKGNCIRVTRERHSFLHFG